MENESTTLAAFSPQELKTTQADLARWLVDKCDAFLKEARDLSAAADEAAKHKWKSSTLTNAASLARKRSDYYSRALKAVEAGYILIPPFPLNVFAVRVNRDKPRIAIKNYRHSVGDVLPTMPPAGEGRYVGVHQFVAEDTYEDDGKKKKRFWASGFDDVCFPFEAAKPLHHEASVRGDGSEDIRRDRNGGPARRSYPCSLGAIQAGIPGQEAKFFPRMVDG